MLPFRVQCETCKALLQVKHEKVVGQIHPCPRCGGMVLLAPPTADAPSGSTPANESVEAGTPIESPAEARGRGVALAVGGIGMACVVAVAGAAILFRGGGDEP
ncbi:MAG: hypothetical protein AAF596_07925, partial [Planctomycetota bacterium]